MSVSTLSQIDIAQRITFHEESQVMEVSFSGLTLSNSTDVNSFYDHIEERIAATGESLWFFLVNYSDARIDQEAWFAFSRRGKELNQAHSMHSVRFDTSEATRRQIERDAGTESFDPNIFSNREAALEHLQTLPSLRQDVLVHTPSFETDDLDRRISFAPEEEIMYVDFSDISFEHSLDVDNVYDFIENKVRQTNRKWYFIVDYEGIRIQSPAWVQYAARGKKLNEEFSLGSVRYSPGSETETDIRLRAESQGFRPNIRNTLSEAKQLIKEMKSER